jgi:uncharacterized protein (DUF305 family)
MENKNNVSLYSIIFLVVGVLLGWLVWGNSSTNRNQMMGNMHQMPDGTMMQGNDMTSMMAHMNASLEGKNGDAFDKAFIDEMIVHHQGAIDMAELAITNAKHQEIKDLAKEIISAQTKEIEQMQSWKNIWYK